MRKSFVLLAVLAFSTVLFGQASQNNSEVFAGYSYMHSGLQNFGLDNAGLNGVELQATHYFKNNIGFTADVTRVNATDIHETGADVTRYTYLFGPTFAVKSNPNFTPYVHVLLGADHQRLSISQLGDASSNSFAIALGGGLDLKLANHVAFRVGQLDYIHTDHTDGENHFRYSTGLVLKF